MTRLGLLLKSYAGDHAYAQRMVDSFQKHNADNLKLYIVVPKGDLAAFSSLTGPNVETFSEELLGKYLVDAPVHDLRPGYINQEIVKLAFWELGLTEGTVKSHVSAILEKLGCSRRTQAIAAFLASAGGGSMPGEFIARAA